MSDAPAGDELDDAVDDAVDDSIDDELDDEDDELDDDIGNRVEGGISGDVLEFVAKAIVDDSESVLVRRESDRRGVTLRLHVAPDDMGKVIGKRGRVAQAIRTVVRAAGAREGTNAFVDIVD